MALSLYNLGVMHYEGRGTRQNYEEAAQWFLKAAEQGNRDAQYNLGIMHKQGRGVVQNYAEAYKWLHLAALNGDAGAAQDREDLFSILEPSQIADAQEAALRYFNTKT